uniref:FXYD domain-containing ion transport regulator n=1 Tax=Anolis carolinensis TaxID=28377 RepID=A0A803TTC1_ANOCA
RSTASRDYDTLRTVGLILAIIMFVLGILIALSESLFLRACSFNLPCALPSKSKDTYLFYLFTVFIFRTSHPEGDSGSITLYTYKANIQCHIT